MYQKVKSVKHLPIIDEVLVTKYQPSGICRPNLPIFNNYEIPIDLYEDLFSTVSISMIHRLYNTGLLADD